VNVVETTVEIGGLALSLEHPPDPVELIDEEAFEQEEFLPYWAELWPSALALARAVAELELAGRGVLELGCGLALPSIVAGRRGAHALATDWSPDAIVFAERNARRNGVELETALVSWAAPGELVARSPWSLVLAADVLYERRNVEPLLRLLPELGGEVLLADPGRPALRAFLEGADGGWEISRAEAAELPRGAVFRLLGR
jgi:predicted nicotinamide N-methyase